MPENGSENPKITNRIYTKNWVKKLELFYFSITFAKTVRLYTKHNCSDIGVVMFLLLLFVFLLIQNLKD